MRTTDMPFALRAGTMITGYEVVRPIGAGGFGITYEGYNPITERRVAIKEFFPRGIASRDDATRIAYSKQDDEIVSWALKRFADSTNRLAKLKHPNIIEVLNYVADNGTGYMVMEHVEGQTLEDWLKAKKTPPQLAELGPIFDPIFDALEYVHSNGLIHRDIAPDNIMIRGDGRPVLIDFGALKIIAEHTRAHGPSPKSFGVVKANYSPPEQGDDSGSVDPRMDVYSLAATIYRAVAGKPPVDADKRKTDTALKGEDSYIPLGKAAQVAVPPEFAAAIDAALSLRPRERPATIAELRSRLAARAEPQPQTNDAVTAAIAPQNLAGSTRPIAPASSKTASTAPVAPSTTYSAPEVKPYTPAAGSADPGQAYTPPGNDTPAVKRSGMSIANIAAVVLVLVGAVAVLAHRPILNLVDRMSGMRFTMGQEDPQQPPQKQQPQKQTPPSQQQTQKQSPSQRDTGEPQTRPQQQQQQPQQQPQQQQQQPQQQTPTNNVSLNRANQLQRSGDHKGAIDEFTKALSADPTLIPGYVGRGISYQQLGDHQRALEDYSVALRLDPKSANVLVRRGNAYDELKEPDRAIKDYTEALRYDRSNPDAYFNRGRIYLARRDFISALSDYSDAVRLDPRRAAAHLGRGLANEGLGRREEAIKDLREALRLDPNLTRSQEALQRLGAR